MIKPSWISISLIYFVFCELTNAFSSYTLRQKYSLTSSALKKTKYLTTRPTIQKSISSTQLHVFIDVSAFLVEHQAFLTSTVFGVGGLFASYLKRTRLAEQAYEDRLRDAQREGGLPIGKVNDLEYLESIIKPEDIYDPYVDDPYTKEDFDPDEEVIKDPFYGDRYYRNGDVFFRVNGLFYRQGSLATRNFDTEMVEENREDFFHKFEERFLKKEEESYEEGDQRY